MASESAVTAPPKRKAVSTGALRTRKKQAVTKTFKRSTIQKIEQNALNSPLLSLPGEIREKILKLVVGDKVIHINTCLPRVKNPGHPQRSLCHSICTEPSKSCECFHFDQIVSIGRCLCPSKSNNPIAFDHISPESQIYQRNTVEISILATSRQLYEECNLLIWHTNIFSFEKPFAFTIFLNSLNPQQKKNIRNLQIRPLVSQALFCDQYRIFHHGNPIVSVQDWHLGDSRDSSIYRLRGVKSLRIHLKYLGDYDHVEPSRLQLELALSDLQVLRSMPLEHAIVEISLGIPCGGARKTVDPKTKLLAAQFQGMLLDPAGPEEVKKAGILMKGTPLHQQFRGNIFSSGDKYFYKPFHQSILIPVV